jgi:hypothetical protein
LRHEPVTSGVCGYPNTARQVRKLIGVNEQLVSTGEVRPKAAFVDFTGQY